MLHSGDHPPIGWAVSVFEAGLSQGGEYHFKCFPKALGCDTIQVPNPGFPHECEHTFTSLLISRVGSMADFLFVSGPLLPDHVYSILCLRVNVNRLFLINRKFFLFLPRPRPRRLRPWKHLNPLCPKLPQPSSTPAGEGRGVPRPGEPRNYSQN